MPKIIPFLCGMLLLASCSTEQPPLPPGLMPVKKTTLAMSPRLAEQLKGVKYRPLHLRLVQPLPQDSWTNKLHVQWNVPTNDFGGAAEGVLSYNFYYGTNTLQYVPSLPAGSDTNFILTYISLAWNTNQWLVQDIFPDGNSYTNVDHYHFAVSAVYDPNIVGTPNESDPSVELIWPPLPPPPWTALSISWDTFCNMTIQQCGSLKMQQWTSVTNVTGTNVVIPIPAGAGVYYRGITTNPPPPVLYIKGAYL